MAESITDSADQFAKPRVLIVAGYFDWFSGYQETTLARALEPLAQVEVVASNRVSPAFSASHLKVLGIPRRYAAGQTREHGVTMTRFAAREVRSMVWTRDVVRHVSATATDLIIQVMPGQLLSAAPALSSNPAPRVVLYGDNRAMWSHLSRLQRLLKGTAFTVSKGLMYTLVNSRAKTIYGYTPDTQHRLRAFGAGRRMELMPLSFTAEDFHLDDHLRAQVRAELGISPDDVVVLAAGKTDPRKRLEWLIAAFTRIAHDEPRMRLVVVGDDGSAHSQDLQREVRARSMQDRVDFLPFADAQRLNAVFNVADIGVWPRNPAITIQQALATGLTVILPDNDLVGHLIRPGAGRYFSLKEGVEVEQLTSALKASVSETDFGPESRRRRADINSWLSADSLARRLLEQAGPRRVQTPST